MVVPAGAWVLRPADPGREKHLGKCLASSRWDAGAGLAGRGVGPDRPFSVCRLTRRLALWPRGRIACS
jgi:hypothetical protein